jgi:hypothetical protein
LIVLRLVSVAALYLYIRVVLYGLCVLLWLLGVVPYKRAVWFRMARERTRR